MKPHPLHVISCGTAPEDLTGESLRALDECDLLYGGKRMLDWFPNHPAEKISLTADLSHQIQSLESLSTRYTIGILASGDSLFFGIASRLLQTFPQSQLVIHPGISAMQAAASRLGLDWHRAHFFSIHGRETPLPWRAILQRPLSVTYGDPLRPSSWIAGELCKHFPAAANRPAHIADQLGSPSEQILSDSLEALSRMTVSGQSMLILGP
ncbi:MAG: precorrin-6y C5,15-methyltransferase (decarboxylating) subunit CbiE, partial [Puniceicoccales bacterium]